MNCGVRPEHVDDFVQSVAVTALQRIQEGAFVQPPEKSLRDAVRVWLAGIVRFTAKDAARMAAFRARVMVSGPTAEHPIDVDVAVPSPEGQILAREELQAIGRMKMSPKQRAAVAMAAFGYTAKEIGERMGVPEDTAATWLKRVRKAWERAKKRGH
jgi:DNA-directed RNA polymerase specialized sigma24 family protein